MNIKDIAATLAILGSGALAMTGCKDKPATEVPGGTEAAPTDGAAEAKCSAGHTEEGHCGDEAAPAPEGEASCSAEAGGEEKAEGSCGGK